VPSTPRRSGSAAASARSAGGPCRSAGPAIAITLPRTALVNSAGVGNAVWATDSVPFRCKVEAMARYVFITGGVVSSLGKGLASAALGALLQARGFSVRLRKLDPYLNVDPGP